MPANRSGSKGLSLWPSEGGNGRRNVVHSRHHITGVIIAKVTEQDSDKIRKASGSMFMGGANLDPERHRKSLGCLFQSIPDDGSWNDSG